MTGKISAELSADCVQRARPLLRSNFNRNLEMIRACRGVQELEGAFAGESVVVVGAGPSLTEALPYLKAPGLHIVAVDRAAAPLLAAGIRPGWIVSVEIAAFGAKKLEGLKGLERIPLVFGPTCCPETVERYPGPLYTFDHPNIVFGKGPLRMGTGVITYAVGLAEVLGASRAVLVGVDLAYPDGQKYAAEVREIPEAPFEGKTFLKSVDGGQVESDLYLAANVEELAEAARSIRLVQTSPRGAFIAGAEHLALEEALR
jgi:hypothetical protein